MRKLDHSMIYVLIAGTYTPMCVIGLREDNGPLYMWIVWSASAIGILLTVFGKMFRTAMGMYIAIGWIAVWIIPHIHEFQQIFAEPKSICHRCSTCHTSQHERGLGQQLPIWQQPDGEYIQGIQAKRTAGRCHSNLSHTTCT
jgi:hypothetical protein